MCFNSSPVSGPQGEFVHWWRQHSLMLYPRLLHTYTHHHCPTHTETHKKQIPQIIFRCTHHLQYLVYTMYFWGTNLPSKCPRTEQRRRNLLLDHSVQIWQTAKNSVTYTVLYTILFIMLTISQFVWRKIDLDVRKFAFSSYNQMLMLKCYIWSCALLKIVQVN